jgi:hypothetical protein
MEFLIKSGIGTLLAVVAASSALFAQNSGPDKLQNHPSILDARQIVALSVAAAERSWQARGLVSLALRTSGGLHQAVTVRVY